jgi:hypothetical protein
MKPITPIRLHAALRGGPRIGALNALRSGAHFGAMPVPNF